MKCPKCNCGHIYATHTYTVKVTIQGRLIEGIKRRRKCRHCNTIFQTFERLDNDTEPEPEEKPFNPFIDNP